MDPSSLLAVTELADEAPPYSSTTGTSPSSGITQTTGQLPRAQQGDDSTVPPPPPYERQGGQEAPNVDEESRLRQIRQAMDGMLRV